MAPIVQTCSGSYINFLDFSENVYEIHDIAYALSNICRFTGHCKKFYSVAQHCVIASYNVPLEYALDALMHDAVEAYLGDVSSPLKQLLPEYKRIEKALYADIAASFGFNERTPDVVKHIDLVMLATEKRDLMSKPNTVWGILENIEPLTENIEPLTPTFAYMSFMTRYYELTEKR